MKPINTFFLFFVILCFSFSSQAQIIYISPNGQGDGSRTNPSSIQYAFSNLQSESAHYRLSIGTYEIDEPITIRFGKNIVEGGFDQNNNWAKTSDPTATVIFRSQNNVEGFAQTKRLTAFNIENASAFHIQNLKITVADAPVAAGHGITTYGIYMTGCSDYNIVRVVIDAGDGGKGADGAVGQNGVNGNNGFEHQEVLPYRAGAGANSASSAGVSFPGGLGAPYRTGLFSEFEDQNTQSGGSSSNTSNYWQSFTCGQSGILSKVQVEINDNESAVIRVYRGEGIGGELLYDHNHSLPSNSGYNIETILFTEKIFVTSGQKYTIWIGNTNWRFNANGNYSGGRWSIGADGDFWMRTFVSDSGWRGEPGNVSQIVTEASLHTLDINNTNLTLGHSTNVWQSFEPTSSGYFTKLFVEKFYDLSAQEDCVLNIYKGTGTGGEQIYSQYYFVDPAGSGGPFQASFTFPIHDSIFLTADETYTFEMANSIIDWRYAQSYPNGQSNTGNDLGFQVYLDNGAVRVGAPGSGGGGNHWITESTAAGGDGRSGVMYFRPDTDDAPHGLGEYINGNYSQADRDGNSGLPGHKGRKGKNATVAGVFNAFYQTGTVGGSGYNGFGGGGGAGGGGANGAANINRYGGDGGGSGGEGGTGGSPGFCGGGSFAIYIHNNGVNGQIRDCHFVVGNGGSKGLGGAGGIGGAGGAGAAHSDNFDLNGNGGDGGKGGDGGDGGDGLDGDNQVLFINGVALTSSDVNDVAVLTAPIIKMEEPTSTLIPYTFESSVAGDWDIDNDGSVESSNESRTYLSISNTGFLDISFNGNLYPDFLLIGKQLSCPTSNILYVDASASGTNDGSSWQNAFTSLQHAIDIGHACAIVTDIYVAKGIYYPGDHYDLTSDRFIGFRITKDLKIYGGFAGSESSPADRIFTNGRIDSANFTILNGDLGLDDMDPEGNGIIETPSQINFESSRHPDNVKHIVIVEGTGSNFLMDGFVVSGGHADGSFFDQPYSKGGAGLFCNGIDVNTSVHIKNSIFIGNSATIGAGVLTFNLNNGLFEQCAFISNATDSGSGAGVYNIADHLTVPVICNTEFRRCQIAGNTAYLGAGLHSVANNMGTNTTLLNQCIVSGNQSTEEGSGILAHGSSGSTQIQMVNTTVTLNSPEAIVASSSSIDFKNSIIFGNDGSTGFQVFDQDGQSSFTFDHTILEGTLPTNSTTTNLFTFDPQFFAPDSLVNLPSIEGDYTFCNISPAINAGDNQLFFTNNSDSLDYSLTPRFSQGPIESINGQAIIDLGPFEMDNQFTIAASQSENDAFITIDVEADIRDCECFVPKPGHGEIIFRAFANGMEIYTEEFLPSNISDSVFTRTITDIVGPDINKVYSIDFFAVGNPAILNCRKYISGSTQSFKEPQITSIYNGQRPDSVNLFWDNKSSLTSGYNILRNDTVVSTFSATSELDLKHQYNDVFSFLGNSFINGSNDEYCIETLSDIYQDIFGQPNLPNKTCDIGSSYDIGFEASDNSHADKVAMSWNDVSSFADQIRVTRNGAVIALLNPDLTNYDDESPVFGRTDLYGIELIKEDERTVGSYDSGATNPNGKISGIVLTANDKFPVRNAKIILSWEVDTISFLDSVYSDFAGLFAFENLYYNEAREFQLLAEYQNLSFIEDSKAVMLDLQSSETKDITFLLDNVIEDDSLSLENQLSFISQRHPDQDKISLTWMFDKSLNDTTYFNFFRESSLIRQDNDAEVPMGVQSASFEDLSGVPGQPYTYNLRAFQYVDSTVIDTILTVVDTFPNVTPVSSINGILTANGAAELTWTHTSNNFNGFRVYRQYEQAELVYEGTDLTFTDFEGRPGVSTKYYIAAYRTVNEIDYESRSLDTIIIGYPQLTPINVTATPQFQNDLVRLEFSVPAIYTSDYNYDGVQIVRSFNGVEEVLAIKDKAILPANTQITFLDYSGIPETVYDYELRPFKVSAGNSYLQNSTPGTATFPAVSTPVGLITQSFVGKIQMDWGSPHTSENYDGFVIYRGATLDSVSTIPYQYQNRFIDYRNNPPNNSMIPYGVATYRIVNDIRYLSDTVTIDAAPPTDDGSVVSFLDNLTATSNIASHIKLCWDWTLTAQQSPFVIRREGVVLDTLDYTMRTYYDYDAEKGVDVEYSIEPLAENISYQQVFVSGAIPLYRSIVGRVYKEESGAGVLGARLDVTLFENGIYRYQSFTETDSTGYYHFDNIPLNTTGFDNSLQMVVSAENSQFVLDTQSIQILDGDTNLLHVMDFIDTLDAEVMGDEVTKIAFIQATPNALGMNITLTWSPENGHYTGFEVYKGDLLIQDVYKGSPLMYIDTAGIPGLLASYHVRAFMVDGEERVYSPIARIAAIFPSLYPVENLVVEPDIFETFLTVKWSHPFDNHDKYRVTRNGVFMKNVPTGGRLEVVDSTGQPGQTYLYEVTAFKGVFPSISESVTYVYLRPEPIRSLDWTLTSPMENGHSKNHLLLEWDYDQNAADGFAIFRYVNQALPGDPFIKAEEEIIGRVSGSTRSYKDFSGLPNKYYTYEVVPFVLRSAALGENPEEFFAERGDEWSKPLIFPTLAPVFDFSAVQIVTKGYISNEFGYAYDGIDGFELYRADTLLLSFLDTTFSGVALKGPYLDQGGTPNVSYEYKVRAFASREDSIYYSTYTTDTKSYPITPPPVNFQASDGLYPTKIDLTWSYDMAVPVQSFVISRKLSTASNFEVIATLSEGERTHSDFYELDIQPDSLLRYDYKIVAVNGNIESIPTFDEGALYTGRLIAGALDSLSNLGISVDIDKECSDCKWAVAGSQGDGFAIFKLQDDQTWRVQKVIDLNFMNGLSNIFLEEDDLFGLEVKISGKNIVASAKGYNNDEGAVYIFRLNNNGNEWNFSEEIVNPNPAGEALFGFGIDLYDKQSTGKDFLAISSNVLGQGNIKARIYEYDAGWDNVNVDEISSSAHNIDKSLLSIGGERFFILRPSALPDANGGFNATLSYYKFNNGDWEFKNSIARYGCESMDHSGDTLVAAAPYFNRIYFHTITDNSISASVTTLFGDPAAYGNFGHSLAKHEEYVLPGYLFRDLIRPVKKVSNNSWSFLDIIDDDTGDESASFGRAVALNGEFYMVGAPNHSGGNGKVNFIQIKTVNPPADVSATDNLEDVVDIDWDAGSPTGNITGYEIYRDGLKIGEVGANITFFKDLNPPIPGKTYAYQVKAYAGNIYSVAIGDMGGKLPNGIISGSLKTAQGMSPVPDATVKINWFVDGDYFEETTITDEDGEYKFDELYYGSESEMHVTCSYLDHDIKGGPLQDQDTLGVTLNSSAVQVANFFDKTAYTISGNVKHDLISNCVLDNILIKRFYTKDDESTSLDTTRTDANGKYSFVINPNETNLDYLTIQYPDYTTSGEDTTFLHFRSEYDNEFVELDAQGNPFINFPLDPGVVLERDIEINFRDTTIYPIMINVQDGCGAVLSTDIWSLRLRSKDGCFEQIYPLDMSLGTVTIFAPPRNFTATLIDVNNKNQSNLQALEYFINNPIKMDVAKVHRDSARFLSQAALFDKLTFDFQFHKPPTIEVTFAVEDTSFMCEDPNKALIAISGELYEVNLDVTEPGCSLTGGYLVINNPAAFEVVDTVYYDAAQMKFPDYFFKANTPNPVAPYVWAFTINYFNESDIFQTSYGHAIFVEGTITLPGNGVLTDAGGSDNTVPMPLYVLRDPPGDESYSLIGTTHETTKTFSFDESFGGSAGPYSNLQFAVGGVGLDAGLSVLAGRYNADSKELSMTSKVSQIIQTAGEIDAGDVAVAAKLVGRQASIIVGTGVVLQFGLSSKFEAVECGKIEETIVKGFTPIALKTEWRYTVQFIEDLIAKYNADILLIETGMLILKDATNQPIDKATAIAKYEVLRDNWIQVIKYFDEETNPIWYMTHTDFTNKNQFPQQGRNGINELNIEANKWRIALKTALQTNGEVDPNEILNQDKLSKYNNAATAIRELMKAADIVERFFLDNENQPDASGIDFMDTVLTMWTFDSNNFESATFLESETVFSAEEMAKNKTINGGAGLALTTISQTTSLSNSSNIHIFNNNEFRVGINVDVEIEAVTAPLGAGINTKAFALEQQSGIQGTINYSSNESQTESTNSTTDVTYQLSDNNPGDLLSMTLFQSIALNHTPFFQTVGGTTSCPHEKGTLSRDMPIIQVLDPATGLPGKSASLYFQNPDEPATYNITITNGGSNTEETRSLEIFLINESNSEGASVKAAGVTLSAGGIGYPNLQNGVPEPITITVTRNQAYDYEGIKIGVRPGCTAVNVSDTITLNTKFQSPCSPVSLVQPDDDWLINSLIPEGSTTPELIVRLQDYVPETPNFEHITLQYRQLGAGSTGNESGWAQIPSNSIFPTSLDNNPVLPDTLAANDANYFPGQIPTYPMVWRPEEGNASLFPDGVYELRAAATCKEGNITNFSYSNVLQGTIDRASMQLFGLPQPADGVWVQGDEISVTFNKNINCSIFNDADFVENNMSASVNGEEVSSASFVCFNNGINILIPYNEMITYDGQMMTISVDGIVDPNGNLAFGLDGETRIEWDFLVTTSKAYWLKDSIVVELYEGETATVEAKIKSVDFQQVLSGLALSRSTASMDWLTLNPDPSATFNIVQGAEKDVQFTFEAITPGIYYDTILVNNVPGNPVAPSIPVKLISIKNPPYPPDWEVDGNVHPNSMTLVSNFTYVDTSGNYAAFSSDTMDQISAWIDSELRGLGRIKVLGENLFATYLTIFGSSADAGKPIEFRVWDASIDVEFNAQAEQVSILYSDNAFVGTSADPRLLLIDTTYDRVRYIPLNDGYTWISLNSVEDDMRPENIMRNVQNLTPGDRILGQFGFAEYVNDTIGWITDAELDTMTSEQTYMVFLQNGPDSIRMNGFNADPYSKELLEGTNWIGFPSQIPLLLEDAIAVDNLIDVSQIKNKDEARINDDVNWTDGTLTTMQPNGGYKILLDDSKQVAIPPNSSVPFTEGNISGLLRSSAVAANPQDASTWNIDISTFSFDNVIPVVGEVVDDGVQVPGDGMRKVAAFIGNDLRSVGDIVLVPQLGEDLFTLLIGQDEIDNNAMVGFYYYDGVSVTDSVFVNINDLVEVSGNGIYNFQNPFRIEKGCRDNLVLTMDDSPLEGLYEAGQKITVLGAVEVLPGKTVTFSAPIIQISSLLDAKPSSTVIVQPDGCND